MPHGHLNHLEVQQMQREISLNDLKELQLFVVKTHLLHRNLQAKVLRILKVNREHLNKQALLSAFQNNKVILSAFQNKQALLRFFQSKQALLSIFQNNKVILSDFLKRNLDQKVQLNQTQREFQKMHQDQRL